SKNICFDTGSARNNTSVILSPQFIYLWGLSFYFLLLSFYFLILPPDSSIDALPVGVAARSRARADNRVDWVSWLNPTKESRHFSRGAKVLYLYSRW
ncbi:MAG: hypothetical protein QNJ63_29775, partial [Calothrix sp. MO_192.B10]|nr:hypothetical protein [Calothrix sp. MO_192.B10]